MTKVQRYKVGYYTDEWGMSSNTPCLIPDDSGYAVKFEDYCKLETELAALKAESEWRDIETAPKDGTVFLAWRKHATHPLMVRYEPSYDWFANYDGEHVYDLTHWMPLPKPPAMAKGENGC